MIIKTICNLCNNFCGLDVHVEDGRIVRVRGMAEHPLHKPCVKPQGLVGLVYSKERITSPLRRVNNDWQEISWDEALDIICQRLDRIREEDGAKALAVYTGNPFIDGHVAAGLAARFCSLYGTPNFASCGSICHWAHVIGHSLTLNYNAVHLIPSFANTRCIVIWGFNPAQSNIASSAAITSARRKGAKLIVIDPRAIPLAKRADIYAQIRPGTDCALALGLLNVIIAEGLYDKRFVEEWIVGFDRLVEHVKDYSPEKVADITWVREETIEDIARTYAKSRPAIIAQGEALNHCVSGVQTSRAIATLIAITGNLDIPGGTACYPRTKRASFKVEGKVSMEEAISTEYPLFTKFVGNPTAMTLPDVLISQKPYPVRALIVDGSNPVLTWPNTDKVKDAFSRLELLVTIDFFMTETAKMAHIFLPAATFVEGQLVRGYSLRGFPLTVWGKQAIAPLGNSLPDWRIWSELGTRMGYGEYFPWRDEDELSEYLLRRSGVSLDQIKQHQGAVLYHLVEGQEDRKEGFNTPSGKVEIYSKTMAEHGYPPLPTFEEPAESPLSRPDLAEKYPLILTTGARVTAFTHSRYRNIAKLRRYCPEPFAEINIQTATALGISDGDRVVVESPRGSIELKAKLSEDIHPRVVSIQHGWAEANANILIDGGRDPISGYPSFRATLCRVTRK
jgi:anaerobic selenocysteine-containing dehydrogenase